MSVTEPPGIMTEGVTIIAHVGRAVGGVEVGVVVAASAKAGASVMPKKPAHSSRTKNFMPKSYHRKNSDFVLLCVAFVLEYGFEVPGDVLEIRG